MATQASENQLRQRVFRYAPLVLWVTLIFVLGSNMGSMSETSRIIGPVLKFLFPNAPPETLTQIHGYIRKLAHVTEYGILAILAARAFRDSAVRILSRYAYPAALLLVLIVAATDEFRQSFEPARTSSPYDVLIDILGGIVALTLLQLAKKLRRRRSENTVI